VLMLAQPEGRASYDRLSSEASLSAVAGMMIVGVLSITIGGVFSRVDAPLESMAPPAEEAMAADVLAPEHVARIGNELFGRHLIAVEVAGTLLLAALVGAAVIVGTRRESKTDV
jgi:NADH:ubiquinone oxidoreductase subunit 6 (subunit J)